MRLSSILPYFKFFVNRYIFFSYDYTNRSNRICVKFPLDFRERKDRNGKIRFGQIIVLLPEGRNTVYVMPIYVIGGGGSALTVKADCRSRKLYIAAKLYGYSREVL